ncbi:MAG: hypothetical protein E6G39_04325 [Actinobacteria bacterium]|nr:MAG: hypothetical protein E6G39_04325 [Actinomycetota bacterium]
MARRILLWLRAVPVALVLGISLYAGLVKAGVARNPFAPVAAGDLAFARSDKPGLRVLFVGNSFTFRNDLPELVQRLSGGRNRIVAVSYTAGGWQLRNFAADHELDRVLHEAHWDVVVLQEQSQIPSFAPDYRAREFEPYVRALTEKIEAAGARPLLFETWGYRTGDRLNLPGDTFALMQARLAWGYADVARAVHAGIAPVGAAWQAALSSRPQLELWDSDGKHPSRVGSYLAACVFYATLTKGNPIGDEFTDGLTQSDARFLQRVAWEVTRANSLAPTRRRRIPKAAAQRAVSTPFRPRPVPDNSARGS